MSSSIGVRKPVMTKGRRQAGSAPSQAGSAPKDAASRVLEEDLEKVIDEMTAETQAGGNLPSHLAT